MAKGSSLKLGLGVLAMGMALGTHADEGMWLFTAPPRAQLKERYNFEITDAWLEHVTEVGENLDRVFVRQGHCYPPHHRLLR